MNGRSRIIIKEFAFLLRAAPDLLRLQGELCQFFIILLLSESQSLYLVDTDSFVDRLEIFYIEMIDLVNCLELMLIVRIPSVISTCVVRK